MTANHESKPCVVTLFAIPKPFDDEHTSIIQRNAIESWVQLKPDVRVILFGNDNGVAEIAHELNIEHIPELETNEQGTPLLSDAFSKVSEMSASALIAYANSDIILLHDFVDTLRQTEQRETEQQDTEQSETSPFLMIGRRTDTDLDRPIDFANEKWRVELNTIVEQTGELAPVVCKDYFVFPQGEFANIPEFAVGRGNWDNWMVANAGERDVRVIDATQVITAIHQNHDYNHVSGGRRAVYATGNEARNNAKLAGGSNLIAGCNSDFRLEPGDDEHKLVPVTSAPFWSDIGGFLRLLKRLFIKG